MLLAILGTGLFLAQPATRAEPLRRPTSEAELAALAPAETLLWLDEALLTLDLDRSGFVDRQEAFRVADRSDRDHDDRVSKDEWRSVNLPIFLQDGVPADWRPASP